MAILSLSSAERDITVIKVPLTSREGFVINHGDFVQRKLFLTRPLRILILEDNTADAELVQFELEEAGFTKLLTTR